MPTNRATESLKEQKLRMFVLSVTSSIMGMMMMAMVS
jgi:hypothetical protein